MLGQRERGHRAVLVAHPEGELFRRARNGPDLVPLAPRSEADLSTAWKLSRILRHWPPDVVHAHDSHAVAMAALALSFGSSARRPTLVAARRVDFHLQRHSFSRWKHRQVDRFIAASEAIRQVLVADGVPGGRICVVHDGVDAERIERLPTVDVHAEFWLPHGVPVVVNVGALVEHKGQKHLVDAMREVRQRVPDAHAILFGVGDLRPALEKQIKDHGLERHLLLAGFREDVLQLSKSADLFVTSSITEGLGSAVLDAMAMGLAVVATRAGGIGEAVVHGQTGLLVRPADSGAMTEAIVSLLQDAPRRKQMGSAGRARVVEQFGVERMIDGTIAAYRS